MKKFYPDLYLLFVWLYITGRICMVSTYTIGQENVRDIKNRLLPQTLLVETSTTFKNEKKIPAILRKKAFLKSNFIAGIFQDPLSTVLYQISQTVYHGSYIDPPKLA
ncbi:MAG: hypothetical protein ABI855_09235 [Bacteroidota bacterium]